AGKKTIANRTSKRATPLSAGGGATAAQVNNGKKASVVKAASPKRRPAVKNKQCIQTNVDVDTDDTKRKNRLTKSTKAPAQRKPATPRTSNK
ncbi:unnamed protein product, partial [Didymodactylos carnosus]